MKDVDIVLDIIIEELNRAYDNNEKISLIIGADIYKIYESRYTKKNMAPTICHAMRKACKDERNPYKNYCIVRNTPSANSSQYRIEFFNDDYWQALIDYDARMSVNDWYEAIKWREPNAIFIRKLFEIQDKEYIGDSLCDEIGTSIYYDWVEKSLLNKLINKPTCANYSVVPFKVIEKDGARVWTMRDELRSAVDRYRENNTTTKDSGSIPYAWYVGAYSAGEEHDYTAEYVAEGIWKNNFDTKYTNVVDSMKVGDKIAIKSSYTTKNNLPFDNNGHYVSTIRIKAIGTIVDNALDGHTISVDWDNDFEEKEWYGDSLRKTIDFVERAKKPSYGELIDYTFSDGLQNYDALEKKYMSQDDSPNNDINEDNEMPNIKLNTILYGPPGTGKTYNTIIYAVAIIEKTDVEVIRDEAHADYAAVLKRYNAYKREGKVEFVTFHQSYGYEEFIEGIKPNVDENDGTLRYDIENGIFKEFCDNAKEIQVVNKQVDLGLNKSPTIWKVSLEKAGDNPTRKECLANGHIRIGWDGYGESIEDIATYDNGGKIILDSFYNRMEIGDIVVSCYNATTTDAIGVITGDVEWHDEYKLYKRARRVNWLVKDIREDIRAINNNKKLTTGALYELKMDVADVLDVVRKYNKNMTEVVQSDENRVFVIDEINRGNISKIFGELITLIEPTKRKGASEGISITLPYSKTQFSVPNNVYILGTMNTADRSITHIDTALRRRFHFVEMLPDASLLDEVNVGSINIGTLLRKMNSRIEVLYDREHTIGHAYFMGLLKTPTMSNLADIFSTNVVPLLQEYFFGDYKKIRLVLGDNNKMKDEPCFVREIPVDLTDMFYDARDIENENTYTYVIDVDNFEKEETYKYLQ